MTRRKKCESFRLRVMVREIDLRFWFKMAIKVLLLMLVPISLFQDTTSVAGLDPTVYHSYRSILFYFENYTDWSEPFFAFREIATIVAALIVCIPAIYFNHRLNRGSMHRPVWDSGLAGFFATAYLTACFVFAFPPYNLIDLIPSPDWELLQFGSLVIVGLVLLPLFAREASQLGAERRNEPNQRLQSGTTGSPSAIYLVLGYALGLAVFLFPVFLVVNVWPDNHTIYDVSSPLASGQLRYSDFRNIFGVWTFSQTWIQIPELMVLLDRLIFTGFRILFGYSIIRYLRGTVSRRRVVSYGIMGIIVPFVYMQIMRAQYSVSDMVYLIPLPFVFVGGYLAIRLVKPLERSAAFESVDLVETPGETRREREDFASEIEVPLLYALKSKVFGAASRMKRTRSKDVSDNNDTEINSKHV
ncbi:MAG: hypothetical protein ACE5H4_13475 [Candidatus Thorarchaeota archaeon]